MADSNSSIISSFFSDANEETPQSTTKLQYSPTSDDSSQNLTQSSIECDSELLAFSNLTLQEEVPINIQPFFNITPRIIPVSPHLIFEEEFSGNPWALLIATIFLTKTAGRTARRYMKEFFEEYPTPYHVLDSNPQCLERFFDSLGLRKRSHMIWKLSYQFVSARWSRASDLYGIGKYGEDAYRIFCLGHTDVNPGDRYLKLYLDWLTNNTNYLLENGEEDCEGFVTDLSLTYYSITLRDM